jgi:hypothetical protein
MSQTGILHSKSRDPRILGPLITLLFFLSIAKGVPAQGLTEYFGQISLNAARTDSPESWLGGGLGRFASGSEEFAGSDQGGVQSGHLGISYRHSSGVGGFIHAIARIENDHDIGNKIGLTQWLLDYRAIQTAERRLTLTAGQFFLPTTMENVGPLWSSPYTITSSSISSWFAEEFRPIGLDIQYLTGEPDAPGWSLGATIFGGNDSLGSLLAWRGWSSSNRFSVISELLPLPDLIALSDEGVFIDQRNDGSKPFGRDLDGRFGWSLRTGWRGSNGFRWQASYVDNRGDRDLHRGQYAWSTHFGLLGFEWLLDDYWTFAGEFISGNTTMGLIEGARVEIDFESAYLLASRSVGQYRLSLRAEHFNNDDRDSTLLDLNDDRGDSVTLAWFWEGHPAWRIGLEYTAIHSDRIRILSDNVFTDRNTEQISLQARYSF